MATTESDYYDLLGVSRGASDAEIKRAFRALARELHPDVSTEPDAAARFRDVAEAYEVLSDPERRATYDRFGKAGLRRGGFETAFTTSGACPTSSRPSSARTCSAEGRRQRRTARWRRPGRGRDRPRGGVRGRVRDRAARRRDSVRALRRRGGRAGDVVAEVPDVRRGRGRTERLAEHVRPVRPAAGVSRVRGRRRGARAALCRLSRRRARRRRACSSTSTCREGSTTVSRSA